MAALGFHASHEQISPGRLLNDVQLAEQPGFYGHRWFRIQHPEERHIP